MQITLRCDGKNGEFYIQDVITLSKEVLASAILIVNKGRKPKIFTGSISSHLSVRSTEAICLAGLQGCRYYSPSEVAKKATSRNDDNSLFGKLKKLVWQRASEDEDTVRSKQEIVPCNEDGISINLKEDESKWFTEKKNDVVSLRNGIRKLYQNPPKAFRVSDEVLLSTA